MKLNSSQLEAFYAIAKTLHFTKAAEILNVTQSALSQRIAKLEEEVETTLFIRDRTSVRLTEAGQEVLRFCQVNEYSESDLLQKLKGSKEGFGGVVRIGGFSSVNRSLVIPALKKMMVKNPELSIQLFTKEIRDLEDLLKRSEADYIITNRKAASADVESIFLGFEENVLTRSKKHPDTQIYIDHDENDPITKGYFAHLKSDHHPKKMRYLDDVYGIIDGVKNGYGMAILPKHLLEAEKDLEVVSPKQILWVSVYLQFYRQPYYRKTHVQVVADLKSHFSEMLRHEK